MRRLSPPSTMSLAPLSKALAWDQVGTHHLGSEVQVGVLRPAAEGMSPPEGAPRRSRT